MARVYQAGFEGSDYDYALDISAGGTGEYGNYGGYLGIGSGFFVRSGSSDHTVTADLDLPTSAQVDEFYIRVMIGGDGGHFRIYDDNGDELLRIDTDDGSIYLLGGDTGVNVGSPGGGYARYEIYYKIHSTAGAVRVRRNGVEGYVYTTGNTKSGGTVLGSLRFEVYRYVSGTPTTVRFDDLAINDTVNDGLGNASWPGHRKIIGIFPEMAGTYDQWTPSPGSGEDNYEDVDEEPPDEDTSYVSTGAAGQRDDYIFENAPAIVYRVREGCVSWNAVMRMESGNASIIPITRKDGNEGQADSVSLTAASYDAFQRMFETAAAYGSWAAPGMLDNSQFGILSAAMSGTVRLTQLFVEAEVEGVARTTQQVVEVAINSRQPRISQFVIEVELPHIPTDPDPGGTFYADAHITSDEIHAGNFTADAEITARSSSEDSFFASAWIKLPLEQGRQFTASAYLEKATWFTADAHIDGYIPDPAESYEDFSGPYEVRLLDHDGSLIRVLDQYDRVEFTRAVSGPYYHKYGDYILQGAADLLPTEEFTLDRIVEVRRLTPAGPVTVFEGLHRTRRRWQSGNSYEMFLSAGPDLKHFATRRVILPFPPDRAFFSLKKPFTDIMRYLVLVTLGPAGGALRDGDYMEELRFQEWSNEGEILNMHYRYTRLDEELNLLSELGADWDFVREEDKFRFEVYFPYKGLDRRRGNAYDNPEMVWSIDRGNIIDPTRKIDRVDEATVTYVGGEGIGAQREIVARHNIADRENDSPWNRIERFIDAASETSTASLAARGDAHNVEQGISQEFNVQAAPTQVNNYGSNWNLGDICTGVYDGETFDMRVVAVTEVLDRAQGVQIRPTFLVYPRLEDY